MPTPAQLNDSSEAKPKLANTDLDRIIEFLFKNFVTNNPGLSNEDYQRERRNIEKNGRRLGAAVLRKEMSRILNAEFETVRIYSMSKRYNNMSLWTKYAADHKGYCLEFSNAGLFSAAREVTYRETADIDVTDPKQINEYFLFHKTNYWSTEEEVRLVFPRGHMPTVNFDPKLLTRIILGRKMIEDDVRVIMDWAYKRPQKLPVVRAEYNEFEQKLNLIKV
ncbi:MAG TPA: DUF2971 domain-containing protein [archaeon]|nr:DUF2971 domain-containing protein [archaeon]